MPRAATGTATASNPGNIFTAPQLPTVSENETEDNSSMEPPAKKGRISRRTIVQQEAGEDGVKCSKEAATAIRGTIILAKLSIVPVRRGFWGNKIGRPHTVPCKVTGKCGSVWVRLIPAPRGTGIVSAPVPKKLLQMAGIDDCYTSARGSTGTLGYFAKATYAAVAATYAYLTPDLWKETIFQKSPYQEFTDYLSKNHKPVGVCRSRR